MSDYTDTAKRALSLIARRGAPVTFAPSSVAGTQYDGASDTFSGTAPSTVTGSAVQVNGDPDRFTAKGLVLTDPVTLLVAAQDLAVTPAPDMVMGWAGGTFTVKDVEVVAPNGVPILFDVVGSK